MNLTDQLARALAGVPRHSVALAPFADTAVLQPTTDRSILEGSVVAPRPQFRPMVGAAAPAAAPAPAPTSQQAPVFQLEPLALTLNPAVYANPATESNPEGSYTSLAAFQQLTDPIPVFTRFYSPSPASTEGVYGNIVNGAAVSGSSAFVSQVIAGAQRLLSQYTLQNMAGVPGTWHPVYASPPDWYDVSQVARFTPVTVNVSGGVPSISGFTTLSGGGGTDNLAWVIGDPGHTQTQQLHPGTTVQQISFQALRVDLSRPWLSYELFQTQGWQLQGQPAGLISSGKIDQNNGIMPLIATGLLIGLDVTITATWAPADEAVLQSIKTAMQRISLGPFSLFAGPAFPRPVMVNQQTVKAAVLQVIGWISEVVPFSPSTP